MIAASRARLAELEAAYTSEKTNVTALQARIFQRLRRHFEERDRLRLVVSYRRTFLNTLLREGEEEAERVRTEYREADARTQQEYEDTGAAMESKRRLSDDEESELKSHWRKLVKLFHPDRQLPSQDGGQDDPGSLGPSFHALASAATKRGARRSIEVGTGM